MNKEKSEFEQKYDKYLKIQALKTTFNKIEIDTFQWFKKLIGKED